MKLDSTLTARAAPPGSMRYYAWLYTPEAQRDFLAALLLLEAELHDSAHAVHEVAHVRLQWWREEIERLIAGKAQHPATQVLQAATQDRPGRFDFQLLHQTLLSAAQELANVTFETDTELNQYLHNGLGALFTLFAERSTDAPSAQLLATASEIGAFIRRAETTRDVRQDFHHGRLYLPLNKLDELNIEYETLQQPQWPDAFVQLLQSRCAEHLSAYRTLKQGLLTTEKQALRPLLVLGDLHAQLLQRLAADFVAHTRQRLELGPVQKLWTAWRTARAAQ